MKQLLFFSIIVMLSSSSSCNEDDTNDLLEQIIYEINEDGTFQDFLTPNYYNTDETELREDINTFVHFVRLGEYNNPFQNPEGEIVSYTTKRKFGDGVGMGGTSQYHPAIDLHPANAATDMYAAHDGIVTTYRDKPKYRDYLTITKEIKDLENNPIGKLVTIYAHIDLDLDEGQSVQLNGLHVNKGDIVSKNLYSGTLGGPHLHFEIRFYRISEIGDEDFYNWQNTEEYTTQSLGIWSYGYWNPDVGYGFGDPINQGIQ
jgi:murein DD-endopeptidase MepM/ murein hydrolase activator NlpD